MKKILAISMALSALVFSAEAQQQRALKNKAAHENHQGMRGHRMNAMNDLNLTEAQKTQLKASREEMKVKMDQLKGQNLTQAQFAERRKALMVEQKTKMESIFTADQRAKLAARKNEMGAMKGKHKGMHGNKGQMLKEQLSLSDDQAAKLKAQHQITKQQKEIIKNDATLSKEAKKQKMMALKNEAQAQRKNILTADQIKKMQTLKNERKDKNLRKTKK